MSDRTTLPCGLPGSRIVNLMSHGRPYGTARRLRVVTCWRSLLTRPESWCSRSISDVRGTRSKASRHACRRRVNSDPLAPGDLLDLGYLATRDAVITDPSTMISGTGLTCIDEYQRAPSVLDAIKAQLNRSSAGRPH